MLLAILILAFSSPQPARADSPAPPSASYELWKSLQLFDAKNMYPADQADGSTAAYFGWDGCFDPKFNRAPLRQQNGTLAPECQPDTLYSWQSKKGFAAFSQAASGETWAETFPRDVFTHLNPAATFAYGSEPVRIKLRPGVRFKMTTGYAHSYCAAYSRQEQLTTVLVRVFPFGSDYILCSPAVIESWSRGTPTHYDEVVSSVLWYLQQSARHNWLPYYQSIPHAAGDPEVSPMFLSDGDNGFSWDGHYFSQSVLAYELRGFREDTANPRIEYAPGVEASPTRHFSTEHPIYWNQRGPGPRLKTAPAPKIL